MVLAYVQYVQNVAIDNMRTTRYGTAKGGSKHPRRI
ncbi:hypothetical protein SAMN04488055_2964 [Chitinophaga niabensis]|uniref:Uncharacterized protein n=1 Tax=Chitinophaga niabensis TaxID=536979 RepID=A0A1N6GTB2_9BACT|nr:hypothetical protein SAMN04488055_2964 [Chitinophaga niabensis]